MARITEISPDIFQITTLISEFDLQFHQFLVLDDEPLLYHTGMRGLFPEVQAAVAQLMNPQDLRWIGFSHFEPDECGSLNQWLALAPHAQAVTGIVGAMVFIGDYADRMPRALENDAVFSTGSHRFRFRHTPHLPHGWDASMLFEEPRGVLFCSDLFHQNGDVEAMTENSVIERCHNTLLSYEQSPLASYMPYTHHTQRYIESLAALNPSVCAPMHGSAFVGDGATALCELGGILKEVFGAQP
jgi:flavorubredoxin